MTFVRRRGRPLGAKAFAVVQLVQQRPTTLRGVAAELQLSYTDATATVWRLAQAGQVRFGDLQRNTGGRPARLVEAVRAESSTDCAFALQAFFKAR